MTGPMRMRALATLSACALALGALAAAAAVPAAAASESKETQQEYEQQLSSGQIASVQLNRRIARVHVTLKDGTRFYYHYGKGERPNVEKQLRAKHVAFVVLSPSEAKSEEKAQPKKHKIRYIAGGALVLIAVAVGVFLLIRRRRTTLAE